MQDSKTKLLTVSELAEKLGYAKETIYQLVSKGEIPHIKLSHKALRFRESEIEEWINQKETETREGVA